MEQKSENNYDICSGLCFESGSNLLGFRLADSICFLQSAQKVHESTIACICVFHSWPPVAASPKKTKAAPLFSGEYSSP